MINRLFQLTAVLLLAILILRIIGKSEKPAVEWVSNRVQAGVAKTSGKPVLVQTRSPKQPRPKSQQVGCPNGTQRTDSIHLGESLALQFRKQPQTSKTITQVENQLGQPNCKGADKAIWMTSDGKAITATQQGNKVSISFSF